MIIYVYNEGTYLQISFRNDFISIVGNFMRTLVVFNMDTTFYINTNIDNTNKRASTRNMNNYRI